MEAVFISSFFLKKNRVYRSIWSSPYVPTITYVLGPCICFHKNTCGVEVAFSDASISRIFTRTLAFVGFGKLLDTFLEILIL